MSKKEKRSDKFVADILNLMAGYIKAIDEVTELERTLNQKNDLKNSSEFIYEDGVISSEKSREKIISYLIDELENNLRYVYKKYCKK